MEACGHKEIVEVCFDDNMLEEGLKILGVFEGQKITMGKVCLTMRKIGKNMLNSKYHIFII